jgi:8-oxo-dGTP diphosphatase
MKKLGVINPRNVTEEEVSIYKLREAVRAIVFDADNKVALLKVSRDSYFKLPGGGVEYCEDFETALKRECLEEIGCEIKNIKPLGCTEEYWKEDAEKQISYCYSAELNGQKGNPDLTKSEMDRGFETVWVTLEEAVQTLESCIPTQWEGDYIPQRELMFLKEFFLLNTK